MDGALQKHLSGQIARGEVVLFTGAGFSADASTPSKEPIPGVSRLRELLWDLAFPGESLDEASTLGDVFEVAQRRAGNRTKDLLQRGLKVDPRTLPDSYRIWFSMPWQYVYTLNVDDLEEAAEMQFDLPRRIKSLSALTGVPPPLGAELSVVHLNGRITDYPDVTFSPLDYAERTSRPDPWYQHLVAHLTGHSVVFVGTQLDEPPLWHHLELRRSRGGRGRRELRPRSYLVTPSIPAARRAILEEFNVHWVEMTADQFATQVLEPMQAEKEKGLRSLSDALSVAKTPGVIPKLGQIRTQSSVDLPEYLLGRDPEWADLVEGYAVERRFEGGLQKQIADSDARVVILTGTAGAGKSTTLKRLALQYHAQGKDVRWLDRDSNFGPAMVKRAIRNDPPDVLVIDDADIFGDYAGELLESVASRNVLVICAMRTTRFEALKLPYALENVSHLLIGVPALEDTDIDLLIGALTKANRLGVLKGMSLDAQRGIFRESAGRQLLVAMIEATSGQKFEERIDAECRELGPELADLYACAVVATYFRTFVTRDELLLAIGESSNEALNQVDRLVAGRLLGDVNGQIKARHRVIAEKSMEYYRKEGQLREPVAGLVFAMSTRAFGDPFRRSREGRLLARLTNHDWLGRTVGRDSARTIYADVERQLEWDYHYWLQRGSLEVEVGDLGHAQNFLEQARALAPDDYKVQTEWGYFTLKKACQDPTTTAARELAEKAFTELEDAIEQRGLSDCYPYYVLASQGMKWVSTAALSKPDRARFLSRLHHLTDEGARNHPRDHDMAQLAKDVQQAYLLTAVPDELLQKVADGEGGRKT